jgi:hypothetical protein
MADWAAKQLNKKQHQKKHYCPHCDVEVTAVRKYPGGKMRYPCEKHGELSLKNTVTK